MIASVECKIFLVVRTHNNQVNQSEEKEQLEKYINEQGLGVEFGMEWNCTSMLYTVFHR
jgi:hypothetical protein